MLVSLVLPALLVPLVSGGLLALLGRMVPRVRRVLLVRLEPLVLMVRRGPRVSVARRGPVGRRVLLVLPGPLVSGVLLVLLVLLVSVVPPAR